MPSQAPHGPLSGCPSSRVGVSSQRPEQPGSLPAKLGLVATLLTGLGACSSDGETAPRWIDLTRGFEPRPLEELAAPWFEAASGSRLEVEEDGSVWVTAEIEADQWKPADRPGAWAAARPQSAAFRRAADGPARLASPERELEPGSPKDDVRPGLYLIAEDSLFISLEAEERPPARITFSVRLENGAVEEDRWRVRTPTHAGYGIPVYSGSRETLRTPIPASSRLSFATGFSTLNPGATAQVTYRVRLEEDVLLERTATPGEHLAVDLPAGGADSARLTFEVLGGDGLGVFYVPTLGPAEVGDYRARPWGQPRPDLVLFIADTFRADNLAVYGGDPTLSPNLNRFAERSLRFLRARSTAAWTLPSISSILTGLFPGQHGATEEHLSLSRSLRTIADAFGDSGYRTCAVTDSGFFSPPFGLDQGFDFFVENRIHRWNLGKTIDQALAWLDADDGRPTLLVVHTYRVHGPFRQGPEEDQVAFDKFFAHCKALLDAAPNRSAETRKAILMGEVGRWVELYEDGVRDMDQKFERFFQEVTRRGLFERGALVFTGDHGQAHGENDDIAHGGKLWDTKLRIPLLLHGVTIEAGDRGQFVSLVDIAPTLARLAGIPAEPDWVGTPLFDVPAERPAFAFRLEGEGKRELAILQGERKLLTAPDADRLRRGEVNAAFDIDHDPGELEDLADQADWPAELARQAADAVELFLMPKQNAAEADVDLELRRRLADIGYTGN